MIKTFTGPMYSGKTAMIITKYDNIHNKELIRCFKPNCDVRDVGVMKSRNFENGVNSIRIDTFDDILNYIDDSVRTIFIDEAQLIKGNVNVLSYLSIVKDIDIYIAGLNMTSELNPFLVMPQILAISDEVQVIKANCNDCGRDAQYTLHEGEKEGDVLVGDTGYVPLCSKCFLRRKGSEALKLLLTNKKDGKEK